MKISRKTFAVAVPCFALVALAVILFFKRSRIPIYEIAYLPRIEINATPEGMRKMELFDKCHRVVLERLIDDFNAVNKNYKLKLIETPLRPEDFAKTSKKIKNLNAFNNARYDYLSKRANLIAVFDNAWGDEISGRAKELSEFAAPVAFLNADHNELDFGRGRLFIGSGEHAADQVVDLVNKLRKNSSISNVVLATETDTITEEFLLPHTPMEHRFKACGIVFDGPHSNVTEFPEEVADLNRSQIGIVKASIVDRFMKGKTWKTMQDENKILILNVHSAWGEKLLPWLDLTFTNLTVIAHQSSIARYRGFSFGGSSNDNSFILLTSSEQVTPERFFLKFSEIAAEHPEILERNDAIYFAQRCEIAFGACTQALKNKHLHSLNSEQRRSKLVSMWSRYRKFGFSSDLGTHAVNATGELLGQSRFLKFHGANSRLFDLQPSHVFGDSANSEKLTTNANVEILELDISSVSIEQQSIEADLSYSLNWNSDFWKDNGNPGIQLPSFSPRNSGSGFSNGIISAASQPDNKDDTYKVEVMRAIGEFKQRLNGRMYPFDRHRIHLEMISNLPDDRLRLSCESAGAVSLDSKRESTTTYSKRLSPLNDIEIDGWYVNDGYVSLATRENEDSLAGSPQRIAASKAHSNSIVVSLDVSRKIWSALLLIIMPLFLMVGGSIAVLFIHFRPKEDATDKGEECESRKVQTELSLAAILGVITYLISYATLAPRLDRWIYTDILLFFTIFVCVCNFVYVVITRAQLVNKWKFVPSLAQYRIGISAVVVTGFSGWFLVGWITSMSAT